MPYYEHHAHGRDDGTWDAMRLYGCVCDSSWSGRPVSRAQRPSAQVQTQEPEYFGPTCAAQHCPSGDDPMTARDETNCTGVLAKGGHGVGEPGNLCHVDCSNRGFCDHETGQCRLSGSTQPLLPGRSPCRSAKPFDCAFCSGFARARRFQSPNAKTIS